MQLLAHKISQKLLGNYILIYPIYWTLVVFALWFFDFKNFWQSLFFLLGGFLLFEIFFRITLFLAYGIKYKYSLFLYFLVDDKKYGTAFRKNADTRKINFPLFDMFVFPSDAGQVIDPEENKKKRKIFSINSLGFRGEEFNRKEKIAKVRIFCLGGSTTACDCNDDDEAWPAVLERKLKEKGFDVEVINAGVEGWYSYKNYLRFKSEISNYCADVALLHEGWNEEFVFSSLSLGKKWKPKLLRNVREEHMLYCPPNQILSSTFFLSIFWMVKVFLNKFVFKKNMSFENPKRWQTLLRAEYIRAWFENMVEMAKIASQKNILLYTVDYPGLVSLEDVFDDRRKYLANSRLTPLYADYQAVSKRRITETLVRASSVIPNLNAEKAFVDIKGMDRVKLFHDEIHMTPEGNAILAEAICNALISDSAFIRRYEGAEVKSNVIIDDGVIKNVEDGVGRNSQSLDNFVKSTVQSLDKNKKSVSDSNIPTERYTTF